MNLTTEEQLLLDAGITPQQLAWRRKQIARMGKAKFTREYPRTIEEAYSQLPGSFIDDEYLQHLVVHKVTSDTIYRHEPPTPNTRYCLGVDVSLGVSGDYASVHVLDCRSLHVVASYNSNRTPLSKLADIVALLSHEYGTNSPSGKATVNIESNSEGLAAVNQLESAGIPLFYLEGKPWRTNASNKAQLLELIRESITNRRLKTIDSFTYIELRSVQLNNYGRLEIPANMQSHFDGGISLGLALWAAKELPIPTKPIAGAFIPLPSAYRGNR